MRHLDDGRPRPAIDVSVTPNLGYGMDRFGVVVELYQKSLGEKREFGLFLSLSWEEFWEVSSDFASRVFLSEEERREFWLNVGRYWSQEATQTR